MSAHEEQPTEASDVHSAERTDDVKSEFSANLIEERIKAYLEPLHA